MCVWVRMRERESVCVYLCCVFKVGRSRGVGRWEGGNHQSCQLVLFPRKMFFKILPSTTSILWGMNILSQEARQIISNFLIWVYHSNHIFHIFIILLWASENFVTSQLLWVTDLNTENPNWDEWESEHIFKTKLSNFTWLATSNYCTSLRRGPTRIGVWRWSLEEPRRGSLEERTSRMTCSNSEKYGGLD